MERKTVTLIVKLELDPVPGAFHTPESAQEQIESSLKMMIPWYNPTVTIQE